MNKLTGKKVIITAGARGIGKAAVQAFEAAGAAVFYTYRNSAPWSDNAVKANLCDLDETQRAFSKAVQHLGGLDILINNAGTAEHKLLIDFSEREIRGSIEDNLISSIFATKAAVPHLLKNGGGKIVSVSSIWGVEGGSMESVYSAAKAGVIGFMKAVQKEYALMGITCSAITPGVVLGTAMSAGFDKGITTKQCADLILQSVLTNG